MKKSTMKKLMAKESEKGFRKYAQIDDIERIDRELASHQWQLDVLFGAEPEFLRTPEPCMENGNDRTSEGGAEEPSG